MRCEQTKPSGAFRMRFLICRSCGNRGKERVYLDERNRVIADNTNVDCRFAIQCNDGYEFRQVNEFIARLRKND